MALTLNRSFIEMANSDDEKNGMERAMANLLLGAGMRLAAAIRDGGYDRVLFLSREGLIFYRGFKTVFGSERDWPPLRYILASRRAVTLATCRTTRDCYRVLDVPFHPQTLKQLFSSRFGVDVQDRLSNRLVSRHEKPIIRRQIKKWRAQILDKARMEREGYVTYLRTKGVVSGQRYLLVDVGYNGTFHRAFERLVPGAYFDSFCLAAFSGAVDLVEKGRMRLAYDGVRENQFKKDFVSRNVACIEALLMAPHPSFVSVDECGTGRLSFKFCQGKGAHSAVLKMQQAVLLMLRQTPKECQSAEALAEFQSWIERPPMRDIGYLERVTLDDSFGGKGTRFLIASDMLPASGPIPFRLAVSFVEKSDWTDGALALLRTRGVLPPVHEETEKKRAGRFLYSLRRAFRSREAFVRHMRIAALKLAGRHKSPRTAQQDVMQVFFNGSRV